MKTLELKQGTKEWDEHRATHFNASEASAMMGVSTYCTRDELLAMKKYGIEKDVSDYVQKFLFDKGHDVEDAARVSIERKINEELYPTTGVKIVDGLPLSASFDGITMLGELCFEHKMWNEKLAQYVHDEDIPETHYWQLEQHLLVSGAEKVIFVVSDGTEKNMEYCYYESVPERRDALIAGWKQFEKDLETFEYTPEPVKPVAKPIMELPALNVQVTGKVTMSNLSAYEHAAKTFIDSIKTDLKTDEDFANAESQVKFCDKAEKQLELTKQQIISQTADIEAVFSAIDFVKSELRNKRLQLDKLVKTQKQVVKQNIINDAQAELNQYIGNINEGLDGWNISHNADFVAVVKGKRTITSLRSAVNDELAKAKIAITEKAELVRVNLKILADNEEYRFLFNDINDIIESENEYFKLLVEKRINDHKQAEQEKLEAERERIRQEEAAKLEAEQKKIEQEKAAKEAEQQAVEEPDKKQEVHQQPATSPVGKRNVTPIKQEPVRPSDAEIITLIAMHFNVDESQALEWIAVIDVEGEAGRLASTI